MKPITFLGDSLARLRAFPVSARETAGYQLHRVQRGLDPADWKPMTTIGAGVREIRVRDALGAFRVIYLATLPDRVLVLHAFRKTSQATARTDLDLAARRLRDWRR
ncbi:MAG: type II toxin-antitoxin system RelE/ParE family toxin [Alphaproteobacteria bacterium]|nr:type II toxin-antitoxin system RelE/ParE family toxin [Alphaproteobacteria bacterium]